MPRPCKKRRVLCNTETNSFMPCGSEGKDLESISITLDELEAIRLADFEGLYQEQAAVKMQISRQTFGNIISSAHKKVADFLINSKQLTIQGGKVEADRCGFLCGGCNHHWSVQCGSEKPSVCPECEGTDFYCSKKSVNGQNIKCWRIA
jgi:predicted DNA-binding protein (UPF0251 family)